MKRNKAVSAAAFTLIELLAVISIIVIIAAFAIPSTTSVLSGSQLTQAAETVAAKLQSARMTALSRNMPVEVRLYHYADKLIPNDPGTFRAIQALLQKPDGTLVPYEKPYRVPNSVGISNSKSLTTFLNDALPITSGKLAKANSGIPEKANYVSFRFRPDGSTDLPSQTSGEKWIITVMNAREAVDNTLTNTNPPNNFGCIQIDPINGNVRLFRPGARS